MKLFFTVVFVMATNLAKGQVQVTSTVKVVGTNASQVFSFFKNCDNKKYRSWHIEHKEFRFIKRTENFIDSEIYFKEVIKGFKVDYTWIVQQAEEGKFIKLKAIYFYPIYLILTFKDEPDGVFVQQDLLMGNKNQFIKFDWLIEKLILTRSVKKNLQTHFIEEFKNLEKLIDGR